MQFSFRLSKQPFEVHSVAISNLWVRYNAPFKKLSHLTLFVYRNGEVTEFGSFKSKVPPLNYTIATTYSYEK